MTMELHLENENLTRILAWILPWIFLTRKLVYFPLRLYILYIIWNHMCEIFNTTDQYISKSDTKTNIQNGLAAVV